MVSWAVTGATRGIGFGFVDKLSSSPENTVFALIRSPKTAGPLNQLAAERKNIHIIVTDISDPRKLDQTAAEVGKISGNGLDVLILNAGSAEPETATWSPTAFHGKEADLETEVFDNIKANLMSNIYVINSFVDLIRNGKEKKIIFVSSQSGDLEFNRITGLTSVLGYSIAKAGMNIVTTKFASELGPEGIKALSLSPGWVNTDAAATVTGDPEVRKFMLSAFNKYDPDVTGPVPVKESVTDQLKVIDSLDAANSGKYLSRRGLEGGAF